MNRFVQLVLLAGTLTALPANAQDADNLGTEFLFGFMPNSADGTIPTPELHLTAPEATSVRVRYPFDVPVVDTTVDLNPGEITIVTLPREASTSWIADAISSNSVHAEADKEFVAYLVNRAPFTSDCALGLPVDALNADYVAMDYLTVQRGSQILVVAPFDDTEVVITPTTDLIGQSAGTPFTITLDRGEGYYAESAGTFFAPGGEVMGTTINADRPVYVLNGSFCANIPSGTSFCDHIFETAHPVQTWGQDVLVANLPLRPEGSIYRVIAAEDGTAVQFDGAPLATIDAGEFVEVGPTAGNHQFTADRPIFVAQYMTGSESPGTGSFGDPAMGNLVPCEQFQTAYTFATVGGAQFEQDFLTIYARNDDVAASAVLLDGAPIDPLLFDAIAGTGYSVAVLLLTEGTHTASAPQPIGITVEGYNDDDSYIYPGGALFQTLNDFGDSNPPVCTLTVDALGLSAAGLATDNQPSEDVNGNGVLDRGEDLNANGLIDQDLGISSVTLSEGSTGLILEVDPFAPFDGQVTFTVSLDPTFLVGVGEVVVEDGNANTTLCPVTLSCTGSVSYTGAAVAGTGGIEPLVEATCLRVGEPGTITSSNGLPFAVGCLAYSQIEASMPVGSGLVLLTPEATYDHVADVDGEFWVDFTIPTDASLIGLTTLWQVVYLDPVAPEGISISERMDATIGS